MNGFKSSYSSGDFEQAIGAALLQEKYSYNITQDKKKNYSSLKEAIAAVTDEKYKVKGLVLTFFTGTEWVVKRYNGEDASGFATEGNWIDLIDKASTTKDGLMSKEDKAKLSNFVSGPTSVTSTHVVVFDGTTGKLVKDSGFTIETSVPKNAKFTDTVYTHPTTSGNKHIPSGGSTGKILKWSADGTAVWGDEKDTTYSKATSTVLGLIKIGYGENGKNYPVELDSEGKAYVNVPWTDTNTTYSVFKAATSDAAGGVGLVPAPAAGKQTSFLRGDGTWVVPTNTTYSKATTTTLGLVMIGYTENGKNYPVELDSSGKMFVNVPWTDNNTTYNLVGANGTTGLIKNGSSVTSASGYTACPIVGGVPYYKDTTYSEFEGATKNTPGSEGLVPSPSSGYNNRFLRGDCSWRKIVNYLPSSVLNLTSGGKYPDYDSDPEFASLWIEILDFVRDFNPENPSLIGDGTTIPGQNQIIENQYNILRVKSTLGMMSQSTNLEFSLLIENNDNIIYKTFKFSQNGDDRSRVSIQVSEKIL